jgi:hypothetical protein
MASAASPGVSGANSEDRGGTSGGGGALTRGAAWRRLRLAGAAFAGAARA